MNLRITKWCKKNMWFIALIAFIITILIPVLISVLAPSVSSEISADGLLGYIIQAISAGGTIFLAYVAIRQNEKLKAENDVSQARLEKLTVQANELLVIGKIIEYESDNLSRLRKAYDDFSIACDPQHLSATICQKAALSETEVTLLANAAAAEKRIDDSFYSLCRELRSNPNIVTDDKNPVKSSAVRYYLKAKQFINKIMQQPQGVLTQEAEKLKEARDIFIGEREKYLSNRVQVLNKAIYGNLMLNEIKKLFHSEFAKGANNGQDEI